MVKIEKQQDPSNEDVVTEVTKSKSDKRKRSADNRIVLASRNVTACNYSYIIRCCLLWKKSSGL